ncbi:NADH dehydrogenase [ubiquinone] 1 alpha subcomplex assembly factor 3 [Cytospora mali]|uniref:NADH dehydrogenase [ubiquinone] 1 alpha subcomplex assembly factor 3 n=1 Tax=Cytospora mali TaxID=578113 RepID=A0A194UZ40_CYTMA|nr:NADH dehydrogenase [ubiquinone] 1 alpha subcomplex assembly factor 3 [Valsa mali var. pyri (nom. inval.)]
MMVATPGHASSSLLKPRFASLHDSSRRHKRAHNNEEIPDVAPTTDFARMDMLGQTAAPSTSVDICMSEGFKLNSGASIYDGKGVMLVDGEAFAWQPWGPDMRLINNKGQWEVKEEAFALLDLLWPRPDLLILGLGAEMRPLSPVTRKYLGSLGLRVEVLDTRNAASQFNMLATERGVDEIAAALIPIGWREGIGAKYD